MVEEDWPKNIPIIINLKNNKQEAISQLQLKLAMQVIAYANMIF